jgi:hypothetical protein
MAMRATTGKAAWWAALICSAALVAACGSGPPDDAASPSGSPSGDVVTDGEIQEWDLEADPASQFGLPPLRGIEPKAQPDTRVLTAAEAATLSTLEVLNGDTCIGRADLEPRCRYRIVLDPLPEDVKAGTVLVAGVSTQAPAGLLVRVDAVRGNTIEATEASLGDALQQGEFRTEQWFAPEQVTETRLAPGVTALPRAPEGGKGTTTGPAALVLGEGMAFGPYGVDVSPAPGVRITGTAFFNAGCGLDAGLSLTSGPWFWTGCELHQATGLSVTVAAGALGVGQTYRLADFDLTPIVFTIAGIPIVIVPHLSLAVRIDGSLATGIDFGAEETVLGTLKAGYDDDGFYAKADLDIGSDARHEMPGAEVGSALGGEMGVEMMLFGIFGPKAWGIGHLEFAGGPGQKPAVCYQLRGGLGLSVVLDLKVKEWEWRPGYIIDRHYDAGCRANDPPTVAISSPTEGQTLYLGTVMAAQLTAAATDPEDGTLPVTWSSNLDGPLGSGTGPVSVGFKTPGKHTLTATTTDLDGAPASAAVRITVAKPSWSLATTVSDSGGKPVALSGGVLSGRQGEVYFLTAQPSAPPSLAQPTCAQVKWKATLALQDLANCRARISLDQQGAFKVTASLTTPWGETVTSSIPVQVGPPPTTVTPAFEGITAKGPTGNTLGPGDALPYGQVIDLSVLYRNASQAAVPVTYAWAYQTDAGSWVALPGPAGAEGAQSHRSFSSTAQAPHQYTFQCVVTPTAGGAALATLTLTLRYRGQVS